MAQRTFRAASGNTARTFTREEPCPLCRKYDGCAVFDDGGILCFHVPGDRVTNGGNLHLPSRDGRDWRDVFHRLPERPAAPVIELDRALMDRAYRALMTRCPLTPDHVAWLAERGIPEMEAVAQGYGSLPGDPAARERIIRDVLADVGPIVGMVPGILSSSTGSGTTRYRFRAGRGPMLLFPFIDAQGRIAGIQVRAEQVEPGENRYKWLSGGDLADGTPAPSCGHPIHHAIPRRGQRSPHVVWVTEGRRKADAVAERMGYATLAVPGINAFSGIEQALAAYSDARYVVVAYDKEDTDAKRENVTRAEAELVRRIIAARPDATILQAVWTPEAGKGVDDAIAGGMVPITPPHPAAIAPVTDLGEVRRLREETRLVSRIVAKNDLGGDVGGAAAIRLVNWATVQATQQNLQPGDVIPLVAKKIAEEYWDATSGPVNPVTGRPRGEWVEAVSRATLTKRIDDFKNKGIIQTTPARHTYTYRGEDRTIEVPGLVWPEGGRIELLRQFASGSVLEPGETRNRGGKREPRRRLVCAVCAGTDQPTANQSRFTCTCCGTIYRSGTVAGDHITLHEALPDHPALVENGDDAADAVAIVWPDDDQEQADIEHDALVENGDDGGDPITSTTDDSLSGEPLLSVEVRERWQEADAILLYAAMARRGVTPTVSRGRLVFDESKLNDRMLRQVFDLQRELVAYIEGLPANAPAEADNDHSALVENPAAATLRMIDLADRGEAGNDRHTA